MELFYDVVFAFAVSQLSHHLLANTTARGVAETVVLLVAVFTVWVLTGSGATYFDIAHRTTQVAILAAMALGPVMNAEIPKAFAGNGLAFVVPLLTTQLGRGVLTASRAPTAALRTHYRRLLAWVATSTPLWLVGALVSPQIRLWWWAGAAAVDPPGVWLAHPAPGRSTVAADDSVRIDGGHITERLRLFLIIALGEVVLTTGDAVSEAPTRALTLVSAAGAFTVVGCLWAAYFGGRGGMDTPDPPTGATRSGRPDLGGPDGRQRPVRRARRNGRRGCGMRAGGRRAGAPASEH